MNRWLVLHEGYHRVYGKDRLIEPLLHECPTCEYDTLYRFENGDAQPPVPAAICFNCGESFQFCNWCDFEDSDPKEKNSPCKECSAYSSKHD